MSWSMGTTLDTLHEQQEAMTRDLVTLVSMDTPTEVKSAVDAVGDWLSERFIALGAVVTKVPSTQYGDVVLARWGQGGKPILVLASIDSPWPIGEAQRRPPKVRDGLFYGPGAAVSKGGLVQLLYALQALHRTCGIPALTVMLVPDHDAGAAESRVTMVVEARKSLCALSLQPASPPHGPLRTARKGLGTYTVTVTGKSSHAGSRPLEGRSAIGQLAETILEIDNMADVSAGTTVNIGVVRGGSRPNIVAEFAEAKVDVRFWTREDGLRVDGAIRALLPARDGIEIKVTGGINRPPMERTEQGRRFVLAAQKCAEALGFELGEEAVAGAGDSNIVAAEGLPALDGLGAIGAGAYTADEWVDLRRMPERAALLASLIEAIGRNCF